jgi:hypothetical protein
MVRRFLVPLAVALGAAGCAATVPEGGTWLATVDNDSYNFDDGNYTGGVGLAWISPPVEERGEGSRTRRVVEALSFLPGMAAHEGTTRHVALGAGQLIFTSEDLNRATPLPGDRPYAGVLFLDASLLARSQTTLTGYLLRLGVVGEPSGAEEVQKELHEWFGADRPRGWDHQLEDEPVVNLGVEHHRRVAGGTFGDGLEWELVPNAGLGLGTYFTGVNVGVTGRVGRGVLQDLGGLALRSGMETNAVPGPPAGRDWSTSVFGALDAYGVAHYLPLDGNVFRDSRSVDAEEVVGKATLGFTVGKRSLALTFGYTFLTDTYETQEDRGNYGSVALAWFR